MEIKSKYYKEAGANKSNALTSAGITVAVVFLGIFGIYWMIMAANGDTFTLPTELHERYCGKILHHEGYSFSSVTFQGQFSDEPKYSSSSKVYSFKVINLREPSGVRKGVVGVKCEYTEPDNPKGYPKDGHILMTWLMN
jgi:hypothetical protein